MPIWFYEVRPLYSAVALVMVIEVIAMIGLLLARRFVVPKLRYHDGVNDAVSGTVQAIGVFYGITVGLIAVGVWNTYSNASELVSNEATAIATLYRDVSSYPESTKSECQARLREYAVYLIHEAWPAQRTGKEIHKGRAIIDNLQSSIHTFEPKTQSQAISHAEILRAYNRLLDARRLRADAVNNGLSTVMWAVIWVGAAISIGIAYFYRIEDLRLHSILIVLMSGFLAMLLFMIVINDKPFYGAVSVSPDPYQQVIDQVIDPPK
jgi:Protein of unknown function (DUF4239)